jgi:hypothetical protein
VRRSFNLTLGILIVAVSAVGGLLPGPGRGTAIIGFVLIAGEFLPAARLLDWAKVRLRHFWQFVRDILGALLGREGPGRYRGPRSYSLFSDAPSTLWSSLASGSPTTDGFAWPPGGPGYFLASRSRTATVSL